MKENIRRIYKINNDIYLKEYLLKNFIPSYSQPIKE